MQTPLTLHDFVINLLCDADARAAFDLDPDGALRDAGLTDVTPADVRDVIPLVADFAPAHIAGLPASLPALGTSALGTDRTDALDQAQVLAAQLPLSTSGLALAAGVADGVAGGPLGGLAAVTGTATGALYPSGDAGLSGHATVDGTGGADFGHDPAGTLDPAGPVHTDVLSGVDGTVTGAAHGALGGALSGTLGGTLDGTLGGTLDGTLDGTFGHDPVHGLTGALDPTVHGVTGVVDPTVHGLTGVVPQLTTGLVPDPTPLGTASHAGTDASTHTDAHLLDLPHF